MFYIFYRDTGNNITNPVYSGEAFNRHYAVVTIMQEDYKEHEYEIIPEKKHKNEASPDHHYDDTVNVKHDNVLSGKSKQRHTSNAKKESQDNEYDDTINVKRDNVLSGKSKQRHTSNAKKESQDNEYDDTITVKCDNVLSGKSKQRRTSNSKNEPQSNVYDDPINLKDDNALPDESGHCRTLNGKSKANIDQNKPQSSTIKSTVTVTKTPDDVSNGKKPALAPKPIIESLHKDLPLRKWPKPMLSTAKLPSNIAETHNDRSTDECLPPKPIIQSIHKELLLRKQLNEKKEEHCVDQGKLMSSNTKHIATIAETHGDLSPSSHLPPKPIIRSIHKELLSRKQSNGKNETRCINQSKPMPLINKPNATIAESHSDISTGKHPPPEPILKSIHKMLPPRKQPNEKKDSHCINQSKPLFLTTKPTAAATKKHGDLSTSKNLPPKPIEKPIHEDPLLRKRYATLDVISRDAPGKYQKPNIRPPLPPKPVTYSNTSTASHQAANEHQKPPPLPPKRVTKS